MSKKNKNSAVKEIKNTQTENKEVIQKNNKIKKVKKEKKESRLVKKLKETGAELKKVTWPTFPKVVKQTGIVLVVVVFFGLVLFGFDYLLKFLFELLIGWRK